MESDAPYVIEWANESHLDEVLPFLRENFDKEEIVLNSMRRQDRSEDEEAMWIDHEKVIKAIFSSSPCLIAKSKSSRKIIAVNQMIVSKNPKFDDKDDGVTSVFTNNRPETKLMQRYFNFLSKIVEETNLYERYPAAKSAVEFYAVAVDKDHRKKGLAKILMAEGISFARSINAGFVFGLFTSVFSAKAAEKLKLESIVQVDLLKEKDERGNPVFQDTPPHNIISVLVLQTVT